MIVAAPLGLLEEDPHGSSMTVMLQGLSRFLLDKIVGDFRTFSPEINLLEQVLCTTQTLDRLQIAY
jgi:PAB-dependent poly(A)-specific ribonuclease subunit 2